jgi:hypothetical protein
VATHYGEGGTDESEAWAAGDSQRLRSTDPAYILLAEQVITTRHFSPSNLHREIVQVPHEIEKMALATA